MPRKNPRQAKRVSERAWNLEEVRELIDLLEKREISEFEMERAGLRVRIRRGNSRAEPLGPAGWMEAPGEVPPPPARPAAGEGRSAGAGVAPLSVGEAAEELHIIKSPIVGTFYASPAPNAPPFVKPGDQVEVGQVLCIVEAMKLMNEIESEVTGEVVRVYIETGQPVEYGESLFAIKPSHKK